MISLALLLTIGSDPTLAQDSTESTLLVPAVRQADHIAILSVEGPIDQITVKSLKRRLEAAANDGADAIVIRLNTPGGELMSTLEICRMLKADAPANTIAWIDPFAFSAGTVIALACRETVIAPNGMFGDSAPVSPLGPIPQTERAKIESPLLAEVIDSARRNHYDERIVQAFVSVGVELWLLRNKETGERIAVDAPEYERIFGTTPPTEITPITPSGSDAGQGPLQPLFESLMGGAQPGAPQAPENISGLLERPSSRAQLGPEARDDWELVAQIVSSDRLLALTPPEAINYGLVPVTIANEQQLKDFLGARTIRHYDRSWSESLVAFLISWPVRIILIIIFLVCLFVEMAMPGTGLFAAGSTVAILILIGAPWLVGLAQWWDILLVFLGLALIATELLLIPGTLVPGIAGAFMLLAGLVGTFVSGDMTSTEMVDSIFRGMLIVFTAVIASIAIIWWLGSRIQGSRFARKFVLETNADAMRAAQGRSTPSNAIDIGTEGVAITDLRPAGRIQCGEAVIDAVSSGRWIRKGDAVRIVKNDMVIEVEKIEQ